MMHIWTVFYSKTFFAVFEVSTYISKVKFFDFSFDAFST